MQKKADKLFLEGKLHEAQAQREAAAKKWKEVQSKQVLMERHTHTSRGLSDSRSAKGEQLDVAPERETKQAVDSAKYELKQEMKSLQNLEHERELIHNRCVAKIGVGMSYEDRVRARDDEIHGLKKAYNILDKPSWE